VLVASVNAPDRAAERLSEEEREAAAQTFYIRSQPLLQIFLANLATLFSHPLRYLRGIKIAVAMSGASGFLYFRRSQSY